MVKSVISAQFSQDYEKLEEKYFSLVDEKDPGVALELIKQEIQTDTVLAYFCHHLLHEVGRHAYEKYDDFGKAMSYQDEVCVSAYMHGVMEGFFSHGTNLDVTSLEAGRECNKFDENSHSRWECYHGIGHGLMYFTKNNLPKTLTLCEQYPLWEQGGCVNGAFMENFNADQKTHFSDYLKESDFSYPCAEQNEKHQYHCYMNAPIQYLNRTNDDYAGALIWCDSLVHTGREACYYGLGAQMARRNTLKIPFAESMCEKAPSSMRSHCISGIVSYLISHYDFQTMEDANTFCNSLNPQNWETCYDKVSSHSSF
jgi:hypothetical protein